MNKILFFVAWLLTINTTTVMAQTPTDVNNFSIINLGIPALADGGMVALDTNGDGIHDRIVYSGVENLALPNVLESKLQGRVLDFNPNTVKYEINTNINITPGIRGFMTSGQIDGLHGQDILHGGALDFEVSSPTRPFLHVYMATASGGYNTVELTGLYYSTGDLFDYDNDGDLDIFAVGLDVDNKPRFIVYTNTNGQFTETYNVTDPAWSRKGSHVLIDHDNDGYMDIVMNGGAENNSVKGYVVFNNGDGTFTRTNNELFSGAKGAFVLYKGSNNTKRIITTGTADRETRVITYDANNNVSEINRGTIAKGYYRSAAITYDFNHDGTMDYYVTGIPGANDGVADLYLNDGTENFTLSTGFKPVGYVYPMVEIVRLPINGVVNDVLITMGNKYSYPYSYIETTSYVLAKPAILSTETVVTDDNINIYPNPTTGRITIDAPSGIEKFSIYTVSGREIVTAIGVNTIDISMYSNGLYVLRYKTKGGKTTSQKIVKH